ncbi:PaaI family thioesterase [Bradyrhizobium tropiciagri]|uniref:PaaI family thioesterase n=1 Tax=Bradyrhizobium tropiciagri TaxID=312253 RepID=UPI001BA52CD2|nr:PaaI family thioesterase [Bradyrhizobium tropiciagri]MBR0869027.1 PaaI family thioesterase [Bradyrhizobium tropiciagri]
MVKTALDRLAVPSGSKLLGWQMLDARPEDGWLRLGFEGKSDFCNPAGFVHGGFLSAMLDDAMNQAAFVKAEGRAYPTTISMTVNYLAPAKVGPVIVEAVVTMFGKTIVFVEAKLMAAAGGVLATATGSVRMIDTAKALGGVPA